MVSLLDREGRVGVCIHLTKLMVCLMPIYGMYMAFLQCNHMGGNMEDT